MSKSDWLSRADFDKLDEILGKLGYGGYYDFLEVLKIIGRNIAAGYAGNTMIDLDDVKTIPELVGILVAWTDKILSWRHKHPEFEEEVLKA
ncbi:hypothetical protein ES702_01810 [subsurface metagenome]